MPSIGASSLKFLSNEDVSFTFKASLFIVFIISNVLVWWLQLKNMAKNSTVNSILVFTGSNFISAVSLLSFV
ncbi:unnamed protein product [Bursaphelenchus xylophilus]|uniref:(pine wood nematode) hypothetical protein n=1 Tax=Bursaphelenchus xylophilus TaxID=6326 RepID=A0A7I8WWZ5_BURXY|nr:unnamed protein product [Bursaphelenchus xylophilus]CAG9099452.1 unnamed protein product [Bursaphelenchus xylophilus]